VTHIHIQQVQLARTSTSTVATSHTIAIAIAVELAQQAHTQTRQAGGCTLHMCMHIFCTYTYASCVLLLEHLLVLGIFYYILYYVHIYMGSIRTYIYVIYRGGYYA